MCGQNLMHLVQSYPVGGEEFSFMDFYSTKLSVLHRNGK